MRMAVSHPLLLRIAQAMKPMDEHENRAHRREANLALMIGFATIVGFFIWCCWIGSCMARLWNYGGSLQARFRKYGIEPRYVRERLISRQKKEHGGGNTVMSTGRWRPSVTTMGLEAVGDMESRSLREWILEDGRVSRLPISEQDDGGDGSQFPDMPVDMSAQQYNEQRFPRQHGSAEDLGLYRLEWGEWVTIHDEDQEEVRDRILDEKYDECIQVQQGEQAAAACVELLQEVAKFLCLKYPRRFWEQKERGERKLWDEEHQENHLLEGRFEYAPLELLGRLTMEDYSLFLKSPFSGKYTL